MKKKWIGWALVAVLLVWVLTEPQGAAAFLRNDVLGSLKAAALAVQTFVTSLLA